MYTFGMFHMFHIPCVKGKCNFLGFIARFTSSDAFALAHSRLSLYTSVDELFVSDTNLTEKRENGERREGREREKEERDVF